MEAAHSEVAVIGGILLAAVGRALGGVNADNQPMPVLLPQQGVDRAQKSSVEDFKTASVSQDLVLRQGEHGLDHPDLVTTADDKAKGRVDSEMIGVIAFFVTRRDLINTLPDHLNQGVAGINRRPSVLDAISHGADDVEALVHLPQEIKTRIRGDLANRKSTRIERLKSSIGTSF